MDLTQCQTESGSTCFQGIQQIKDKLYLPNVEDPLQIIEEMAGPDKIEVNFLADGSLSKSLDDTFQSYVFINFEGIIDVDVKSATLTYHDQLVTKLYNELLSKNQRLLVIFTGKRSGHHLRFREISSAELIMDDYDEDATVEPPKNNISGIFWQRDEFLLFYTSFDIVDDFRNESMFFSDVTGTDVGTSKAGTQVNVSMIVEESEDYFEFIILGKNGYWWIDWASWNDEQLFLSRDISAVTNFSFHCTPSIKLFTANKTVTISWRGLQLQPNFNSTNSTNSTLERFGDAWDCVSFFSPGIMCGLFVVSMLLSIMFIGISCIMDINTNDRFDNSQRKVVFNVLDE